MSDDKDFTYCVRLDDDRLYIHYANDAEALVKVNAILNINVVYKLYDEVTIMTPDNTKLASLTFDKNGLYWKMFPDAIK